MRIIKFENLTSKEAISLSFGVPVGFIDAVISNPDSYYSELRIPKKGKNKSKYRVVYKASEMLAHLHSEIKTHIEHNIYDADNNINNGYVTKFAHGYIRGKGIVQNARVHLNKKYLINFDIEDFFKSITTHDVYHVLVKLGTPDIGADIISNLITYNGKLEEGLHCSPLISNLYCFELDLELSKIASGLGCSYSRYADDISFSSSSRIPKSNVIEVIFKKYHFTMNREKTRFSKKGQPQYVTGLSVSDSKYPRIPKPMKHSLRQELYYLNKFGVASHFKKIGIPEEHIPREAARIIGLIRYISAIEPLLGNELKKQFKTISV